MVDFFIELRMLFKREILFGKIIFEVEMLEKLFCLNC